MRIPYKVVKQDTYMPDDEAFIFSFTNQTKYYKKDNTDKAIGFYSKKLILSFGEDLCIAENYN